MVQVCDDHADKVWRLPRPLTARRDTARDLAMVLWKVQGPRCLSASASASQVICPAILPADSQDARSDENMAIAKR